MRLPTQLLLLAATTTAAPYADLTYDAMRSEIIALAREQPRFVRLFTGREAYGDLANVVGGRCSAKHACGRAAPADEHVLEGRGLPERRFAWRRARRAARDARHY